MGLTITQAVWLVGVHSILHGIFGTFLVSTSFYVNLNAELIHAFIAVNILLIVMGFAIFCVVVWRRPLCCKVFAAILIILALIYFIIGLIYFITYLPFYANSVFDSFFYYTDIECWVGPDYAMTFWHVLTFLLVFLILLWFFYGYLLCKLAHCVCFIPCPPQPCLKRPMERCVDDPCGGPRCCHKAKWYQRIFRNKCERPSCCPTTPPPGPPPCSPCSQPCSQPCSTPCSPCPRKTPKFVLTLKPGRLACRGVYLISFHCGLQGVYGIYLVITSFYKKTYIAVNLMTIISNGIFVITGIFVFGAVLYNSLIGAQITIFLLTIVALFNIATSLAYFSTYVDFQANALLDKDLFWNNDQDWIDRKSFPFTIWHVLAISLVLTNFFWFYYSCIAWQLSRLIKAERKPEVIESTSQPRSSAV